MTRSEAVYLDGVTSDASTGFVARICRFPEVGLTWQWLHVFHHGHVHSYTNHESPCSSDPIREDDSAVTYDAGEFRITRNGDRFTPDHVSLSASALMHSGPTNQHGEGVLPCVVEASFQRQEAGVQSRSGRSEVLGITEARITLGDSDIEFAARGQFHEQVQEDPRFNRPFSYATLRGEGIGCIFIRGPRGATGSVFEGDTVHPVNAVRLAPPGVIRRLEIGTATGRTFSGEAVASYEYEIPIFHTTRPGTLVSGTLAGLPLSGCINDLLLSDLAFDHL